jgi:lipoprotein-anchoring transpeptidase ErfK/SrfK
MQRSLSALLLSVAGTLPASAQGYYYYARQQPAPQPYYQQQYVQPQPAPAQRRSQQHYVQPQQNYAQPQPQYAKPQQQQYAQPQYQYAQPQYPQQQRSGMGGGFIEYIFTGGQNRHAVPHPVGQPPHAAPGQPIYGPAESQVRYASLPPQRHAFDPRYEKQIVDYATDEEPGTVVIDTPNKFLYLVQDNGKALRYGIGVGRPGFTWAGSHKVTAKREWPDWFPPKEMLQRQPHLPKHMAGGPDNPLGARALYLGSTLYRIHGSNEPWTIGTQVSSGCIRLRNDDVIDLYERVNIGTKVVVI